jgi:hypothetical protein
MLKLDCTFLGYKYIAVYFPLVVLQWLLAYKCTYRGATKVTTTSAHHRLLRPFSHGRSARPYFGTDLGSL